MIKEYPIIGQIYSHYKGRSYEVLIVANHTDTDEELVIYKSIEHGNRSVYARPLSQWFELVENNEGKKVKRFSIQQ